MKWNETEASKCRYGEVAGNIWGDSDVIWEDSEANYQGHATILAVTPDGKWWFYEWFYGSCSGCDTWEAADMSNEAIEKEMRDQSAIFDDAEEMLLFLSNREPVVTESREYGTGGLVGMLDCLSGGTCDRQLSAYKAMQNYVSNQPVQPMPDGTG